MKNTKYSIAYEFSVDGTHDEILEIGRSLTRQSQIIGKIKKLKNDRYSIHNEGIEPFEISINLKSKPYTIIVKLPLISKTSKIIRQTHAVLSKILGKIFFEKVLKESNFHGATVKLKTKLGIQSSLTLLKIDEKMYGNIDGIFKQINSDGIIKNATATLYEYNHANKSRKLLLTTAFTSKSHATHAHFSDNHFQVEKLTFVCAELINEAILIKKKRSMYDQGVPLNKMELLKKRGINYSDRVEIELSVPIFPTWKAFIAYCRLKFKDEGKNLIKIKTIKAEL